MSWMWKGKLQKSSELLKVPSLADSQLIPELLRTMYREKVNPFTLAEGGGLCQKSELPPALQTKGTAVPQFTEKLLNELKKMGRGDKSQSKEVGGWVCGVPTFIQVLLTPTST